MRIFISFTPDDLKFAYKILPIIENHADWFVDMPEKTKTGPFSSLQALSDTEVGNVSDFNSIEEKIIESDVLIIVYSWNYKNSKSESRELNTILMHEALNTRKKIFIFAVDNAVRSLDIDKYELIFANKDFDGGLNHLNFKLGEHFSRRSHSEKTSVEDNKNEIELSKNELIKKQYDDVCNAYRQGQLTLVTGAGISEEAKVPTWDNLLDELIGKMAAKHTKGREQEFESVEKELDQIKSKSSLIVGQYLKNSLQEDFLIELRNTLYKEAVQSTQLIDAICHLSRPERSSEDLDSIITFNFDDLLEQNFSKQSIAHKSIYQEGTRAKRIEIPIYHVHGFLPSSGDIDEHMNVVLSEDAYHDQFIDPFSWSNLIQLSKYSQNTCLFVGLSLSDPNLRRLLDVSNRKEPEKDNRHFIFQKRSTSSARNVLIESLQEQDASALGLSIIWVDEYSEISNFITKLARDTELARDAELSI